jgi:ribosome biogenesis protein MAK21
MATADASFMRTILSGGTMTDRISALTLLIQSSPLHHLHSLEQLFSMAKKKNRRQAVLVVDSLKDLLNGGGLSSANSQGILPANRKLRFFIDSLALLPEGHAPCNAQLVLFAFEDRLKKLYFEFLGSLEQLTHDTLPYIRSKAISHILDLLVTRPEQEKNLLLLLVNKLGDQDRKLAAKASFLLHKLTSEHHPAMKLVVIKSMEEFMMRPNVGPRAHYCGVITLNQMMLHKDDKDTPLYLIDVYFGFFNKLVKDTENSKDSAAAAGKIDHKILSGLLTGVNRAFPFVQDGLDGDNHVLCKHLDTLFKISHHTHFSVKVQALSLIYQVMQTKSDVMNRFYRSLYATLLDAEGISSSKQLSLFMNLLYRSLKADPDLSRIQAFTKRLLQLAQNSRNVGFVIGCLWIVSHVFQNKSALWSMVQIAEDGDNKTPYDPFHRTPEFSRAGSTCLWELIPFALHYHPSVQVFAMSLLEGKPITLPAGVDPLETYTLAKFLDKFVYRKPKKNVKVGPSNALAQTMSQNRSGFIPDEESDDENNKTSSQKTSASAIKVGGNLILNSEAFARKDEKDIAADEVISVV